ncbi:type II secretion system GspH family protein [Methylovorus menthalis]|uniref:pilus assembly FimT family protein n=1 Tax=Methylovorus menthalis TaxID=1002227 RepID=UPI001E60A441|nr:type II secretion system protein [Methylovorus menthalis]MCB4812282.1 type II secretion system GspH family protein [Methylovorus menthalis]
MLTGNDKQSGYTFLGLLLVIMIAGLVLAQAGNTWSNLRQREREQELLKVGDKIREAIGNYYQRSPGLVKQYPRTLEALLRDDRFPQPQRYLRQLYADPLTGIVNWGVLEAPSGGIMGVYSLAPGKPFKQRNFPPLYESFEKKKLYTEWMFAYLPEADAQLNPGQSNNPYGF